MGEEVRSEVQTVKCFDLGCRFSLCLLIAVEAKTGCQNCQNWSQNRSQKVGVKIGYQNCVMGIHVRDASWM
jgi:hypothetical protein